jgi:hypothetical protein
MPALIRRVLAEPLTIDDEETLRRLRSLGYTDLARRLPIP